MARTLVAVTALVIFVVGGSPVANAHSELIDSDLPPNAILERAPETITLTFSQKIRAEFAQVTIASADNRSWHRQVSVNGTQVQVAVDPGVPVSTYTVGYRVISDDGDPISGSFAFRIVAVAAAPGSEVTTALPPAAGARVAAAEGGSGFPMWLMLPGIVVLLAAGLFVVLRGSRFSR